MEPHGENTSHDGEACPGGLALMRLHTEDLTGDARDVVTDHVGGCDRCQTQLEQMEQARERALDLDPFEEAYPRWIERSETLPDRDPMAEPPVAFVAWWRHQVWQLRRFGESPRGWATAAMVVAGIALVVALLPREPAPDRTHDPIHANRFKGEVSLDVYALRGDAVVEVPPGQVLQPGDRIQFTYTSGPLNHLVLVGVDGNGVISRYYPDAGTHSQSVVPGSEMILEDSLVLDDAPGPEVFVAVFSDEPVEVLEVEAAMRGALGGSADPRDVMAVDLPPGVYGAVATTWIDKERLDEGGP